MKIFFNEKDGKITDKVFSQNLIISVISILLCLVALCSMTYAWFSADTSSNSNTIVSGSFDVTVSVTQIDDETATASDEIACENGKYTLRKGTYKVVLTPTEETNVKGYCVVKISPTDQRNTQVIVNDKTKGGAYPDATAPLSFTIMTDADVEVEFEANWGIPAEPGIKKDDTVTVKSEQNATE